MNIRVIHLLRYLHNIESDLKELDNFIIKLGDKRLYSDAIKDSINKQKERLLDNKSKLLEIEIITETEKSHKASLISKKSTGKPVAESKTTHKIEPKLVSDKIKDNIDYTKRANKVSMNSYHKMDVSTNGLTKNMPIKERYRQKELGKASDKAFTFAFDNIDFSRIKKKS